MSIHILHLVQGSGGIDLGTWLPLLIPLIILELILILVALIDLVRRDPQQVRGSKLVWALIILLVSTLGPICYLLVGRKEQADVYS
jgi:hypothetical protein